MFNDFEMIRHRFPEEEFLRVIYHPAAELKSFGGKGEAREQKERQGKGRGGGENNRGFF